MVLYWTGWKRSWSGGHSSAPAWKCQPCSLERYSHSFCRGSKVWHGKIFLLRLWYSARRKAHGCLNCRLRKDEARASLTEIVPMEVKCRFSSQKYLAVIFYISNDEFFPQDFCFKSMAVDALKACLMRRFGLRPRYRCSSNIKLACNGLLKIMQKKSTR